MAGSSKKRAAPAAEDEATISYKQTCRPIRNSSAVETDVIVVVGGKEFHEHSFFLCSWSSYFATALRSGMKETTSKRFAFPDRDPNEWEFIVELVAPFPEVKLTKENVHRALSWLDELCCTRGLIACDQFLKEDVAVARRNITIPSATNVQKFLNETLFPSLTTALQYNLERCQAKCRTNILFCIEEVPCKIGKECLSTISMFMKEHECCRSCWWDYMMQFLSDSISDEQKHILLDNDLLSEMVYLGIRHEFRELGDGEHPQRYWGVLRDTARRSRIGS